MQCAMHRSLHKNAKGKDIMQCTVAAQILVERTNVVLASRWLLICFCNSTCKSCKQFRNVSWIIFGLPKARGISSIISHHDNVARGWWWDKETASIRPACPLMTRMRPASGDPSASEPCGASIFSGAQQGLRRLKYFAKHLAM